jgi:hypothetical protein
MNAIRNFIAWVKNYVRPSVVTKVSEETKLAHENTLDARVAISAAERALKQLRERSALQALVYASRQEKNLTLLSEADRVAEEAFQAKCKKERDEAQETINELIKQIRIARQQCNTKVGVLTTERTTEQTATNAVAAAALTEAEAQRQIAAELKGEDQEPTV